MMLTQVVELQGPACLMPHFQPNAAMALHSPLTSFVTFPGVVRHGDV